MAPKRAFRRLFGSWLVLALVVGPAYAAGGKWPDLRDPIAPQGDGAKDAALIVAVEEYLTIPGVPGALDNGDAWFRYLVDTKRVPVENVTLLRNSDGTAERIRRFAAAAAARVGRGGTLWFVFVGHGAPDPNGKDGLLVGVDAQQEIDSLTARSVPQKELLALLGKGQQARTVALIDACFSGRSSSGRPLVEGLQPLVAVDVGSFATAKSTVLLSAGTGNQFAGSLPGLERPAFSYLALGALRGWADADGDRTVSVNEALAYTRRVLQATVRDREQTPQLLAGDAAQPLATGAAEAGPDLGGVVLATARPPSPARGPRATDPAVKPATRKDVPAHDTGIATRKLSLLVDDSDLQLKVGFVSPTLSRECEWPVTVSSPCSLDVPAGIGELEVESEKIEIPVGLRFSKEDVSATIVKRGRWPLFLKLGLLALTPAGVGAAAYTEDKNEPLAHVFGFGGILLGTAGLVMIVYDLFSDHYVIK